MGKYDIVRRCAKIRDLLQENKYTDALEMIDEMPLREVSSIEDLYLYADLYEKAERMDKKKEIYYLIYDRTHSRHVLNRLLRLVLRLGDMEEARELFLTYEFIGEVTLETFELRYMLAKAEGEPRTVLIQILEELKKEEYTEEWGYQLARLYELEGMREKCIRECKDLQLWFGVGRIVEKAKELQARCESPDWVRPVEDEIPEPEEPDIEETITYAAPPVKVEEMKLEEPEEPEEEAAEPEEPEEIEEPEEEAAEPEEPEEIEGPEEEAAEPEEPEEPEENETEPEEPEIPEILDVLDNIDEYLEPEEFRKRDKKQEKETTKESGLKSILEQFSFSRNRRKEKKADVPKEIETPVPTVTPQKVKEPKPMAIDEAAKNIVENLDDLLKEDPEDISERGIRYYTLKSTIDQVRRSRRNPHFVFAGGEERITLAVAKRIAKELNNVGYFSASSIVKISADKLNQLELEEQIAKLEGACMLVTDAQNLSKKTIQDISDMMSDNTRQIVVMMSGPFDELDCFMSEHSDLSAHIYYKVRM